MPAATARSGPARHGVAWALALPFLIGAAASPARASDLGVPTIASISFRENAQVSDGKLRSAMRLGRAPWWNPFRQSPYPGSDYLTQDLYRILDLYRDEGFALAMVEDAEVRISSDDTRVEITITVDEGPRVLVGSIATEGIQPELRRKAEGKIRLQRGDWLRRSAMQQTRDDLEAFLVEVGYLGAHVRADFALEGQVAAVRFLVREGPLFRMRETIVDTTLGGISRTSERVLTREVALRRGDVLRSTRILQTQDRLFELGIFRTVRVMPSIDSLGGPDADLRIVVQERNSGWYGFGAGYSSDDRVRFLAEWGNRNLWREAHRLVADGDISFGVARFSGDGAFPVRSGRLRMRYTSPWSFGARLRSQTTAYHSYETEFSPDNREKIFDQDITGIEELLRRGIGRHSTIGIGISNKWVRTGDPQSDRNRYQTRNLSAALEEDRRDSFLDPRRGSYQTLLAEYAGGLLGGQNEFSRWTASSSWYRPLARRWVLATRLRAGWIVPVGRGIGAGEDGDRVTRIPTEERFRLGGGTTVRGYRDNTLGRLDPATDRVVGGTSLLLGNLELRFPLFWLFSGALFVDAGNVWADPSEIKLARFRDGLVRDRRSDLNVAYSVGGGLRFLTPVGPFRIDYGYKLGGGQHPGEPKDGYHLSLGQAF